MTGSKSRINLDGFDLLFRFGALTGLGDAELLAHVSARSDARLAESAFGVLVERHGPMVWGTCRMLVPHRADAEDAFQATFLVLARRAGSVRVGDSLGPWLRGVARRVATRARKRRGVAGPLLDEVAARPGVDGVEADERAALVRAEVERLPATYRQAITLCYLDGVPLAEAAGRLGWPLGTVKGRLWRARAMLRDRLGRREWLIVPPLPLRSAAVDAAMGLVNQAGGWVATGAGPVAAVALAEGVIGAMTMTKLMGAGAVVLAAAIGVAGVAAQQGGDRLRPYASQAAGERQERPGDGKAATRKAGVPREGQRIVIEEYIVEPPDLIQIEVLEALPGRPIRGERLVRPDGTVGLDFYGDLKVAGLTRTEIKVKVIEHMRRFLTDETLGLEERQPEGDERRPVPARDSDRVFVDVTAYNSKRYYVGGDVAAPGRLVITGSETVLDAINYVGGLLPTADRDHIMLVRPPGGPGNPGNEPLKLAVDFDAIERGGDTTTNYQIFSDDRLIVYRDPDLMTAGGTDPSLLGRPGPADPPATPGEDDEGTIAPDEVEESRPLAVGGPSRRPGGDPFKTGRAAEAPVAAVKRGGEIKPEQAAILDGITSLQGRLKSLEEDLAALKRMVQRAAAQTD